MSNKSKYLTDKQIRNLTIESKEVLLACSPKLYLRIHPNGSKYFEYRYTLDKKQKTKRIGVYGVVTLADARIKAEEFNVMLQNGIDPSFASPNSTTSNSTYTMVQMVDDYFLTKKHLKPLEFNKLRYMVNNHILKHIGQLPVRKVDFKALNKVFMGIGDKPETFRKCKQHMIAAYKNAICSGLIQQDTFLREY